MNNNYESIYNEIVDETIFHRNIKGLKVYLLKKEGFSRKMVTLSVNYGSINNEFSIDSGKSFKKYPEGIAHFLEHKLFESNDGSHIFEEFAKHGASVNAFTDYNMTAYYFTTVEDVYVNTKNLIKMVFNPNLSEENVEKEKPIIVEELKMYMDNPQSRAINEMYDSLYKQHNVRFDIGGTVDSVNSTKVSDLLDSYNAFYRNENMVLVAVGDIDAEEFFKTVEDEINESKVIDVNFRGFTEPKSVVTKHKEIEMGLSVPMFTMAFKDNEKLTKKESVKKSIVGSLFSKVVFGKSSDFYEENYKNGSINDSFYTQYTNHFDRGEFFIGLDSKDLNSFKEKIKSYLENECQDINFYKEREQSLNLIKRAMAGNFITRFNFIDSINNMMFRSYIYDLNPFDYYEILKEINYEDLFNFAKNLFDTDNYATILIK